MYGKIIGTAAAGVVALGMAASANAGQIIQTFSLPNTTTDITGATGTGTFDYWQTACVGAGLCGENLTSVQLQIAVGETMNALQITNNAANPDTFQYITFSNITVVGTAPVVDKNNLKNKLNLNGGTNGNLDLFDTGSLLYASGETKIFAPPPVASSPSPDDTLLQNSLTTGSYDTTGTFTLGFTTLTFQSFIGGGGNAVALQSTVGQGTVTVIYNSEIGTEIPEPATLGFLGLGLAGLGLIRRRRS